DDLGHGHAEGGRELLDRGARADRHWTGRCDRGRLFGARLRRLAGSPCIGTRARRLGVDDDAALAPPCGGASSWSPWSVTVSRGSVESSCGIVTFLRSAREKARREAARSKHAGRAHV